MNRVYWLFSLFACLGLVLAACQPPAAPAAAPSATAASAATSTPAFTASPAASATPAYTATPRATPSPALTATFTLTPTALISNTPFPDKFSGVVEIDGRKIFVNCRGTGSPTILLENGLDYLSWGWDSPRYYKLSRTCILARPGTVLGEPVAGPRTTQDQVKDLHEALQRTGIPGPYLLVGHSVAAYNLLLFTNIYPGEVLGLVCVDCGYPLSSTLFVEKLKPAFVKEANPAEAARDYAVSKYQRYERVQEPEGWKRNKEALDLYASAQQVMQVKSLGARPFVVLVAGSHFKLDETNDQLFEQAWQEAAARLSQLSSQGRVELSAIRDHTSILRDEAVDSAVQEVLEKVKKP